MKKKLLALTLALAMSLPLVACGEDAPSSTTGNNASSSTSTGDPIIMKVAGTFNDESFMGIYLHEYFKPYVEEHSNGRISV